MSFMQLQVWCENSRYARALSPDDGEGYFPDSILKANPDAFKIEPGSPSRAFWWAWYSAPGYLDHTDPVYAETAVEAAREAFVMYGDDDDPEARAELASVLWKARKADREGR